MEKTKKQLVWSVASLFLCILMFVGTTFAWFSDKVSSGNNKIVAGNLDIEMYWTDDYNSGDWHNVEDSKYENVFGGDLWEPGYVQLRYIKIVNAGNLAFKYKLGVAAAGSVGKLAEAIDVYCVKDVTENIDTETTFEGYGNVSSLEAVLKNEGSVETEGKILPADSQNAFGYATGETVVAVALKMREDAGNEYQNENIGDGFYITARATQIDFEEDDFDNYYDKDLKFPEPEISDDISTPTEVDEANVVKESIVLENGSDISAVVPAGVILKDGVKELTLSVKNLGADENITATDTIISRAFDVHIEGVSPENKTPIIVTIKKALPTSMNSSAIELSHKENGGQNQMTYKKTVAELTAHNDYTFDNSGTLTLALCSFSKISIVANSSNPWGGDTDTTWYNTTSTSFTLKNVEELAGLATIVNNGTDDFKGKTIVLGGEFNIWNINKENAETYNEFTPIGQGTSLSSETPDVAFRPFRGTFDGNGKTICGLYHKYLQNPAEYNKCIGLFGSVENATVKNLNIYNSYIESFGCSVGLVCDFATGTTTFDSIVLKDNFVCTYNNYLGGVLGCAFDYGSTKANITFKNIDVNNSNQFAALWGTYDLPCGGIVGSVYENSKLSFNTCNVSCEMNLYNDCCANYQWFAYRYSGMLVGYVRGNSNAVKSFVANNITCTNVTVKYGEWTDLYYCELISLGKGSYNGEHEWKYQRINKNQVVRDETGTPVNCTAHNHAQNNAQPGRCSEDEDQIARNIPFNQLFGGGQGVYGIETKSGVTIIQNSGSISVKLPNVDKYIYRVGNGNAVSLGSLFKAEEGTAIISSAVHLSAQVIESVENVEYTANTTSWTAGTLEFKGTGIVKLTLSYYDQAPIDLYLEVVNGINATTATSATSSNVVLLNDVSGTFSVKNGYTFYGNGFTVTASGRGRANVFTYSFISIYDGTVEDTIIKCDIYPEMLMYTSDITDSDGKADYMYHAVGLYGKSRLVNSFVEGARAAAYISTDYEAEINNSVISGGTLCNILVNKTANLILDNVTTIQIPRKATYGDDKYVLGLGVFIPNDTVNPLITLRGDFKQYNWVSKNDGQYIPETYQGAVTAALGKKAYVHTVNKTDYVNLGIIYSNNKDATVNDERPNKAAVPYVMDSVTFSVKQGILTVDLTGKVCSYTNTAGIVPTERFQCPYVKTDERIVRYEQSSQYELEPAYNFDYTEKNYVPKSDESNEYCVYEDGKVNIAFEQGNTFSWDTSILTLSKRGQSLPYKVYIDDVDYTGKSISFTANASKTVKYVYTDENNYRMKADGGIEKYSKTYTKYVYINANAVLPGAKHAEFTFGGIKAKKVKVGNDVYIMPDTSVYTGDCKEITVKDDNGNSYTIYCAMKGTETNPTSKPISATGNNLYPYITIFENLSITDYSDSGTGSAYTYNSKTTKKPDQLEFVAWEHKDSAYSNTGQDVGFTKENSTLVYKHTAVGDKERRAAYFTAKFKYTDSIGSIYYFYVGDYFGAYTPSSGGCLVEGEKITMADGTLKPVEDVKAGEMVLAFNHFTGQYEPTPVICNDHADRQAKLYKILSLDFADGTNLEISQCHGLFDATLNEYVFITYDNYEDFIGHEFIVAKEQNGKMINTVTVLENAEIFDKVTRVFAPVTYANINCIANGVLTVVNVPGNICIVNYFDYDENLKFNEESMKNDIENYGLYTYDEWEDYISYDTFNAFNVPYMKILVEKGIITETQIKNAIVYAVKGNIF